MKLGIVLEVAIVFLGITAPARAETKRVRMTVSALPRQDQPITVDAKYAVLPDGARHGSTVPKSWKLTPGEGPSDEFGHCTADRRGSISTVSALEASAEEIWEKDGKFFFDRSHLKIEEGKVSVVSAERVPILPVSDGIWAYRSGNTVRLVMARDVGVLSRAIFWGCSVDETAVGFPTGTVTTASSPDEVNFVIAQMRDLTSGMRKIPRWKGAALSVFATVSKASADPEPMLNVVIRRPDPNAM